MSIAKQLAAVSRAETDCVVRSAAARAAWRGLTTRLRQSATAPRVVIGGLVAGFLSGLRSPSSGTDMANRLATTLLESVIASLGAGLAAGAAAEAADKTVAAEATTHTQPANPGAESFDRATHDPSDRP